MNLDEIIDYIVACDKEISIQIECISRKSKEVEALFKKLVENPEFSANNSEKLKIAFFTKKVGQSTTIFKMKHFNLARIFRRVCYNYEKRKPHLDKIKN